MNSYLCLHKYGEFFIFYKLPHKITNELFITYKIPNDISHKICPKCKEGFFSIVYENPEFKYLFDKLKSLKILE
jgi:hypothetical protein